MSSSPSWIYDKSSTTGGGPGPDFVPAPPVVIDVPNVSVRDVYDGQQQIDVPYTVPGATAANWKGAAVYLEDPDLSSHVAGVLDGSAILNGSTQLSGTWNPTKETDSVKSPATLLLDGQPAARSIRVYLASFGPTTNATLARATATNPTPSVVIQVPAYSGKYVRGQEYGMLILNPSITVVDDFDNPDQPLYHMNFYYEEPDPSIPLPPGMDGFGGVQTVYEYPSGQRIQAKFLDAKKPLSWVSDSYPAVTGTFRVWFASADINQRVNTIVPGVTPYVDVSIVYPPPDQLTSPVVTDFAISSTRWEWLTGNVIQAEADATWTPPDSSRYSGVEFWRTDVKPPVKLGDAGDPLAQFTLETVDWPQTAEDWTITAIAYDYKGKLSDDPANPSKFSPHAIWHVGPPVTGDAPLVDATNATATYTQELGSDGVVRMNWTIGGWVNPTDPQFAGVTIARVDHVTGVTTMWDVPTGETTFTTNWEPAPAARDFDFYFLSRDPQGNLNALLPGTTPALLAQHFAPMEGQIIASRLPDGWWNEDEFSWPSYPADGGFTVDQIVAPKIYVGSILRIGGGQVIASDDKTASFAGNKNGQIAVYNSQNVIRGWIGEQDSTGTPDNPAAHSVYGAWFAELYVGGAGPPSAPLYATNQGVVIVGGFDTQTPGGTSYYPYISIRRNDGIEVGRIGARLAYSSAANGGQLVPPGNPADIGGAWFSEFAIGGQSLADWRILSRRDPTTAGGNDLVNIRNINKFTIDWPANYPYPASNPNNAAMSLAFGSDAYVYDVANSQYNKFPGISLLRTSTTHGINLINRGLVLYYPQTYGTAGAKAASLITYNGDQYGGDAGTFWSELTMYSTVFNGANVSLRSGSSGSGSAYFLLVTQIGQRSIEITEDASHLPIVNVYALSNWNGPLIDATGTFVGGNVSITGSVTAGGGVSDILIRKSDGKILIDRNGSFTGPGINTPGGVGCAGVNPLVSGTQWNGVASATFTTADGHTITVKGGVIVQIV
jgi:hypothetical protein